MYFHLGFRIIKLFLKFCRLSNFSTPQSNLRAPQHHTPQPNATHLAHNSTSHNSTSLYSYINLTPFNLAQCNFIRVRLLYTQCNLLLCHPALHECVIRLGVAC